MRLLPFLLQADTKVDESLDLGGVGVDVVAHLPSKLEDRRIMFVLESSAFWLPGGEAGSLVWRLEDDRRRVATPWRSQRAMKRKCHA